MSNTLLSSSPFEMSLCRNGISIEILQGSSKHWHAMCPFTHLTVLGGSSSVRYLIFLYGGGGGLKYVVYPSKFVPEQLPGTLSKASFYTFVVRVAGRKASGASAVYDDEKKG